MRSMLLSAVTAASLSLAAGSALAADPTPLDDPLPDTGWYVGILGGASWADEIEFEDQFEVELDTGFTVGGMLGLNFAENFRGELEFSYAGYDIDDCEAGIGKCPASGGDISAFYALANLWYDFDLGGFSPYIGGGVGAGMLDVNFPVIDDSEWGLAFQAGTGVRFGLGDVVTVDVGYRFKGIPDIGSLDSELYSHNAQVGLIFEF